MATNEVWNLWGAPQSVTTNASPQVALELWNSGAITNQPGTELGHSKIQVSLTFQFAANPAIGDSLLLGYFRHDGTQYYGQVGAAGVLTLGAKDIALDGMTVIARRDVRGAQQGPYTIGGVIADVSRLWQIGIYLESGAPNLVASPTLVYQYFNPQGQP